MLRTENGAFLTLEDTILSYSGQASSLDIPAVQDGHPLSVIGKGAFGESPSLNWVSIPREIRRIGYEAFSGCDNLETVVFNGALPELGGGLFSRCPKLKSISLRSFPVSEEQYRQLRENSSRMTDGRLVPERFPDWPGLEGLGKALDVKPYVHVPKTADCVFQDRDLDRDMQDEDQRRFRELIRRRVRTPCIPSVEEVNDLCTRRENLPTVKPVALLCADDRQTVREGRTVLLRPEILIGRFYWQSKVEIACDGQMYYLYQRNYLTAEARMEYIRQNICVFAGETPLKDERRAGEIYAKYQLSSIL